MQVVLLCEFGDGGRAGYAVLVGVVFPTLKRFSIDASLSLIRTLQCAGNMSNNAQILLLCAIAIQWLAHALHLGECHHLADDVVFAPLFWTYVI